MAAPDNRSAQPGAGSIESLTTARADHGAKPIPILVEYWYYFGQ
ncbi:MAG: hypothetical protein RIG67_06850 [Rhodospirillales bacterium]